MKLFNEDQDAINMGARARGNKVENEDNIA